MMTWIRRFSGMRSRRLRALAIGAAVLAVPAMSAAAAAAAGADGVEALPRGAMPIEAAEWPRDWRLHLKGPARVQPAGGPSLALEAGHDHDLAVEHPPEGPPWMRLWRDGVLVRGPEKLAPPAPGRATPHPAKPVIEGGRGWVQPLERTDHAALVAGWDNDALAEGRVIYENNCRTCHGTIDQPGSLPTAPRFAEATLRNGTDPHAMFLTLTHGFGQMMPQPQYTTAQKYAVIHYIRETFFRTRNPSQLAAVDLVRLPRGLAAAPPEKPRDPSQPPYLEMELGNAWFWTFEVAPGNFAHKAIAVRLDAGPGGVTKGRAWMVYEHDTLRVAAATTGALTDWRGIALDGSHGTHASLTGERHFTLPGAPGWSTGRFEDPRDPAKDGKRYGPVPGLRYRGLHQHDETCVLEAEIGGTPVLESPGWIENEADPVFVRTLNLGAATTPLRLRVAPDTLRARLDGPGELQREDGFWVATLGGNTRVRVMVSRCDDATLARLAGGLEAPLDLGRFTRGGPCRWPDTITTRSIAGDPQAAFTADEFPLPADNPWRSWLRPGGFDFTPDGRGAVVAMWNGDVWRVDGIHAPAPATLTWRRIASGLFQPLGVKFRGDRLFVLCRDQLAELVDHNRDGECDFIRCMANGAQVTEHFHEFAMGLQTDAAGNFYYAKSGRHALDSVVPQHGTLLKVSADGASTGIIATGFRAANGVCLNPDGSFFVTDQEGFWTPKNRINRVVPGRFYGNMFGYSAVRDPSDAAMEPPMVWITNAMDRSPAELVRVPPQAWGDLGGALLNLSYGTGRAYIVPHEEVDGVWQGAVCELPMAAFATGIMRGRFAADGSLHTCGMYAWAGNATLPGGFHRIRRGPAPAAVPLAVNASIGRLRVRFSDPVAPIAADQASFRVWSLKRSAAYGSPHINERPLAIRGITRSVDGTTVTLDIPDLAPTHCYELRLAGRVIHGTIHRLAAAR